MAMPAAAETSGERGGKVVNGKERLLRFKGLKGVCLPRTIQEDGKVLGLDDVEARIDFLIGDGYEFRVVTGAAFRRDGRRGAGFNLIAQKKDEKSKRPDGLVREMVYSVDIDGEGVSAAEYEDLMTFLVIFGDKFGEEVVTRIAQESYEKIGQSIERNRVKVEESRNVPSGVRGLAKAASGALEYVSDRSPVVNRGVLGSMTSSLRRALEGLVADEAQMRLALQHVDLYMAALRRHFPTHLQGMDADAGMEELSQFSERALQISVKREELEASAQAFRANHDLQVEFVNAFKRLSRQRGTEPDPVKLMQLFVVYGAVTGQPEERMTAVMEAYEKLSGDEAEKLRVTREHDQQMALTTWNGAGALVKNTLGGAGDLLTKAIGEVRFKDGRVEASSGLIGVTNTVFTVTLPQTLRGFLGAIIGGVGAKEGGATSEKPEGLAGVIVLIPQAFGKGLGGGVQYFWNESGLNKIPDDSWNKIIRYASLTGGLASLAGAATAFAVGLPVVIPVVLTATMVGALTTAGINEIDGRNGGGKASPNKPAPATRPMPQMPPERSASLSALPVRPAPLPVARRPEANSSEEE